jgi:hypothetical protein
MNLKTCILILTTANTSNIEIRAQTKAEKYRESLSTCPRTRKENFGTCPRLKKY